MQEIKYIIVLIVSTFYFEWKAGDLIIVKIMPARLTKIVARLGSTKGRLGFWPSRLLLTGLSVLPLDYLSILKYVARALHSPGVTTIMPEYKNK